MVLPQPPQGLTESEMASLQGDPNIPMIDLHRVVWPEIEFYDVHHGIKTAQLAASIVQKHPLFPGLSEKEKVRGGCALWCAALLHDLGRRSPWRDHDPGHNEASAGLAEAHLKGDARFQADAELREGVFRLIRQHDISRAPHAVEKEGPFAVALHDADRLEAARILPNTEEGLLLFEERTSPEKLCTAWAKRLDTQETWMKFRGWR